MTRAPGLKVSSGQNTHNDPPDSDKFVNGTTTIERPVVEKDATERKLENFLFGDENGFLDSVAEQNQELALLNDYGSDDDSEQDDDEMDEDEAEKEEEQDGLRDEDLFMIDTAGTGNAVSQELVLADEVEQEDEGEKPAWQDSDDERLTISLASHSRLRKLRRTEADDLVTGMEYSKRLREQYESLHPTPGWALPKAHRKKRRRMSTAGSEVSVTDEDEEMDDESLSAPPLSQLLRSAESLVQMDTSGKNGKTRPLPQGNIDIQRLRNVGDKQPSAISSLCFHPTVSPPLLLSSGPSGLLSMHHISAVTNTSSQNPANNPLLTSLAIPSLAINTSSFHSSGQRIFFAGRRRYFHVWDLPSGRVSRVTRIAGNKDTQRSCENFKLSPCGRYMALAGTARKGGGVANILDATTGQWIAQARVEGKDGVADLAWWQDGEGLVVLSHSGEVVEYNVAEKRVVTRWRDQGAIGSTVIAIGGIIPGRDSMSNKSGLGPDRWVAVGSKSGIVNIYDRVQWRADKLEPDPEPRKVLSQLLDPTSHLHFSPDGQLLVIASKGSKDALKLVHLPSCTVYKNWPTSNTPLNKVTSVAWASNGRLLAIGSENGKITLFEIRG